MISSGKTEYKNQKTFVKVFPVNYGDIEKEINDWIKNNEDKYEIIGITFLDNGLNNAMVIAVCHHANRNGD